VAIRFSTVVAHLRRTAARLHPTAVAVAAALSRVLSQGCEDEDAFAEVSQPFRKTATKDHQETLRAAWTPRTGGKVIPLIPRGQTSPRSQRRAPRSSARR
jgi:hypothetical protein